MKSNNSDIENLREVILLSDAKVWGIVSEQKEVGKTYISQKIVACLRETGKKVLYLKVGDTEESADSMEDEMRKITNNKAREFEKEKNRVVVMSDLAQLEKNIYDKNFEKLLDSYKNNFDYVIVDMMSLEENSIAKKICRVCDNNLFVITKDAQDGMELQRVIRQLEDINVQIYGIVMNEYSKRKKWLKI